MAEECEKYLDLNKPAHFLNFNCKRLLPLYDIKHILGPSLFIQYEIDGRNIYLFGEFHDDLIPRRLNTRKRVYNIIN